MFKIVNGQITIVIRLCTNCILSLPFESPCINWTSFHIISHFTYICNNDCASVCGTRRAPSHGTIEGRVTFISRKCRVQCQKIGIYPLTCMYKADLNAPNYQNRSKCLICSTLNMNENKDMHCRSSKRYCVFNE